MQIQTQNKAGAKATKRPPRQPVPAQPGAKWLTDLNLAVHYECHWMTPWRWAKESAEGNGTFPQPYKLAPNMTRWSAAEIEAHDQSVLAGGAK